MDGLSSLALEESSSIIELETSSVKLGKTPIEKLENLDKHLDQLEQSQLPPQKYIAFLDTIEYDKYLLGKSYFDVKEFDRAAFVLEKCKSARCRFLRIYSKYLVCKQITATNSGNNSNTNQQQKINNKFINLYYNGSIKF